MKKVANKVKKVTKPIKKAGNLVAKPFAFLWRIIKMPFIWLYKFKIVRISLKPFGFIPAFARYFRNSWHELKQVRWPDRKSTWSMTGAVIAFSIFFVVLIVLLDAGFNELFKLMLG